jgi:hypothetical protein
MLPSGSQQVPGPCYDLEAFKTELRSDNFHVYKSRALDVIQRLRGCTKPQARRFARDAVLSLAADDFAHTLLHGNGQLQDVYGKLIAEEGWYLKIEINVSDGEPGIVSCHPAEYDLGTRGGVVPRARRRQSR